MKKNNNNNSVIRIHTRLTELEYIKFRQLAKDAGIRSTYELLKVIITTVSKRYSKNLSQATVKLSTRVTEAEFQQLEEIGKLTNASIYNITRFAISEFLTASEECNLMQSISKPLGKRSISIQTRVTNEEYEAIKAHIATSGVSVSNFLRYIINQWIKESKQEIDQLSDEISGIFSDHTDNGQRKVEYIKPHNRKHQISPDDLANKRKG